MTLCPIFMIAAPASRQGKTLFTAALARYYARQNYRVKVFKIGPDFLDPKILHYASGQTAENLDLWMMGHCYCQARLMQARQKNDLVLVESVMGLFDHEPSNADFAQQFKLPIILIADATSMGASFAAIAYGLVNLQPNLDFVGIIANRVGSDNHRVLIQKKLPADIHFLGAIPRDQRMQLPERHLGLYQPQELHNIDQDLHQAADIIDEYHLQVTNFISKHSPSVIKNQKSYIKVKDSATTLKIITDKILPIQNESFNTGLNAKIPLTIIAIAQDAAFSFIYQSNVDFLQKLSCQLVFFSPLEDQQLPACDAVWLTGGYPELYAAQLEANLSMRQSIQHHVQHNKPIYAECGGMLYLAEQLQTKKGAVYNMCGVLSAQATMQNRLQGIGMQSLNIDNHTILGHSFHHARFDTDLPAKAQAQHRSAKKQGERLYQEGAIYASFLHLWFASSSTITQKLFGLDG